MSTIHTIRTVMPEPATDDLRRREVERAIAAALVEAHARGRMDALAESRSVLRLVAAWLAGAASGATTALVLHAMAGTP